MTLDDDIRNTFEEINKQFNKPRCEYNGELVYQTIQGKKRYCACSDEDCVFYKAVKGQDLCTNYVKDWRK